ncbi:hypothetical protein [Thiothrix winogradskyi]|uniref:Uncharacterized protein n=1 Tax=Thiothrix winogradskyi TaxID=96472 RepID=A0ABY3SWD3_9GAMM|nr:hypothetical protein [Thiothrix winogradskyi]UJS23731.1 hypothetical protein L2Y54_17585 [Thiothrix winogradskyi]
MQHSPSLDILLEHMRLRGIAVGAAELQRLQAVFSRAPNLSREALLGLLQTVLAKDDSQRRSIERLFETLVPFDGEVMVGESPAGLAPTKTDSPVGASPAGDSSNTPAPKKPRKPLNVLAIGLGILAIIVLLLLWWVYAEGKKTPPVISQSRSAAVQPFADIPKAEKKPDSDLKLVDSIELWSPTITKVESISPFERMLPPLALLLGAGLGLVWLLHQALLRTRVRQPQPPLIRHRGKFHLPPLQGLPDYHLLGSEARREMGWGISHYLSEQPLNRLDIERSVAETARSGLPSIHFRTASREREVWLWQDQSSTNPDLSRLADEISGTLQAVNIFVQRGYFHGLPARVLSPQAEVLWSTRHEYPENQPLVVVLCDQTSLAQMEAAHADEKHATLHLLGHWANLCMVDCSPQPGELCRQFKPYALECLLPQEVSGWLARQGGQRETAGNVCPLDELHRWALACALPERPLMEAEIRALHEALRLDCAWQYHSLKRYARESGTGFDFTQERRGLLQELAQLARAGNADVARALAFWSRRYAEMDRELGARETPERPWKESRRQRLLALDVALLGLWETLTPQPPLPEVEGEQEKYNAVVSFLSPSTSGRGVGVRVSAEQLYDLHSHADLRKEVERKLGAYGCLDWPELSTVKDKWIRLPLRWGDLAATTRKQLLAAGFGGKAQNLPLRLDKATGILMGVLAGLTLAGFVGSVWALMPVAVQVKPQWNSAEPS